MKRIALTGGIAEGKSTVLSYFAERGVQTVSADDIVQELWQESHFLENLSQFLKLSTPFDKSRILELMGTDAEQRRKLNTFFHPEVFRRLQMSDAVIFEIPLLFEVAISHFFSRVWVVTCGEEEQLKRLSKRLGGEEKARKLLSFQISSRVKSVFADKVFRTNFSESTVRSHVAQAIQAEKLGPFAR